MGHIITYNDLMQSLKNSVSSSVTVYTRQNTQTPACAVQSQTRAATPEGRESVQENQTVI